MTTMNESMIEISLYPPKNGVKSCLDIEKLEAVILTAPYGVKVTKYQEEWYAICLGVNGYAISVPPRVLEAIAGVYSRRAATRN